MRVTGPGPEARAHAGPERRVAGVGHQCRLALDDIDELVLPCMRVA